MNRRKFIENSGRKLSATLLALLGGYLILEREVTPPAPCGESPFCRQCLKFNGCEKPQAVEYRASNTKDIRYGKK